MKKMQEVTVDWTGIESKGHTPVYKMHRYFARRPHNVIHRMIERNTEPGGIVLDCFCGGGVTLFEGLALGRRVVAVDVNPLASFITECQTTRIALPEYQETMKEISVETCKLTKKFYSTSCRVCGNPADVRWFELAYKVICPSCGKLTLLSNRNTLKSSKFRTGYQCGDCRTVFTATNAKPVGYDLVSVIYKCPCSTGRSVAEPVEEDLLKMVVFEQGFDRLAKEYDLWFPDDLIPSYWDRQKEDGLSKRSIESFSDLFTRRSLFFTAYLLKLVRGYKLSVSPDLYKMLVFTFSAIARFTNKMTYSAKGWMDGRPIAWDKHAYWIPNQFVEVNPLEYIQKRTTAVLAGMRYQQQRLKGLKRVDSFRDLEQGMGTHIVWTRSSHSLPIPNESIDAVVTDPPYGSNVQYGELSSYWLVWLRNELSMHWPDFMKEEIVVHRRSKDKNFNSYYEGLRAVFSECFRVMKRGGVLTFTFNNRDIRAWHTIVRAVVKSGFHLDEKEGVSYQGPIENYRNTAHLRFRGALQGDFVYKFRKLESVARHEEFSQTKPLNESDLVASVSQIAVRHLSVFGPTSTNELYTIVLLELTPVLVGLADVDNYQDLNNMIDTTKLDAIFSRTLELGKDGKWRLLVSSPPIASPAIGGL